MIDFSKELQIKTTRSGGKGGQNVNKVETQVEVRWDVIDSLLFTPEEKERIQTKLSNKINSKCQLIVVSNKHRTQIANKQEAINKITQLVFQSLQKNKIRKPTKIPNGVLAKRKEDKRKNSEVKNLRKKVW